MSANKKKESASATKSSEKPSESDPKSAKASKSAIVSVWALKPFPA